MVLPFVASVLQLLLLVQVPPTNLGVLEVPLETPNFCQLPNTPSLVIQDAFQRQEVHRSSVARYKYNFRRPRILLNYIVKDHLLEVIQLNKSSSQVHCDARN